MVVELFQYVENVLWLFSNLARQNGKDYITVVVEVATFGYHLREMSLLPGVVRPVLELEKPPYLEVGRPPLLAKKTTHYNLEMPYLQLQQDFPTHSHLST